MSTSLTSNLSSLFINSQNLRYLCELDWIHPEDNGRRFIVSYSLADGTIKIGEVPRRNSGIKEGKFLKSMRLQTPESDPNFPTYFTPDKFYIGKLLDERAESKHKVCLDALWSFVVTFNT